MARIKATKTKLYEVVRRHFPVSVKLRETEFIKYYRSDSYALDFRQDGVNHHFFLAPVAGDPMLCHDAVEYDDAGDKHSAWHAERVPLEELRALGMLE